MRNTNNHEILNCVRFIEILFHLWKSRKINLVCWKKEMARKQKVEHNFMLFKLREDTHKSVLFVKFKYENKYFQILI